MARTIVKICGITRVEDARAALAAGADWLGFILQGESPRRVSAAEARTIVESLSGTVTVGVMVGPTPEDALRLAREARVARLQVHGVEPSGWPAEFPLPVTFVVPVAEDGALRAALPPRGGLVLLDTAHAKLAGGTGRAFPWAVAAALTAEYDVMVAGGLDPENVSAMLEQVSPWGVDASSRLESSPGRKDPLRVKRFVDAVRAHDARIATRKGAKPS